MKLLVILTLLQVNPLLGQSIDKVLKHYEAQGCQIVDEQITPNPVTRCDCPDSRVRLYHKDNVVHAIVTEPK
jgi:hypothetical protein